MEMFEYFVRRLGHVCSKLVQDFTPPPLRMTDHNAKRREYMVLVSSIWRREIVTRIRHKFIVESQITRMSSNCCLLHKNGQLSRLILLSQYHTKTNTRRLTHLVILIADTSSISVVCVLRRLSCC